MNISFPHILISIPKLSLFVPDLGSITLFCKGTDSIIPILGFLSLKSLWQAHKKQP